MRFGNHSHSRLPIEYREAQSLTPPGMNVPSMFRPWGGDTLEPGLQLIAAGSSLIASLIVPVR